MQLDGKVAIVTGGGSGIGRAITHGLAREGAAMVVVDIAGERAQEVACYGITVNAIAPGRTDTPFWRAFRTEVDVKGALKSGRVGQPEDFVPMGSVSVQRRRRRAHRDDDRPRVVRGAR